MIEERRQCSEDLLQFSANIPALYNSQHIQDFFKVPHTHAQKHITDSNVCNIMNIEILFQGGEVHDGSELIGPAEPFLDFLADSLSDCSSDGTATDTSSLSYFTVALNSEMCGNVFQFKETSVVQRI